MANREPFYHQKALLPEQRVRWMEISPGIFALTGATVIASADGTMMAKLDEITSALIAVDHVHHEVHEGEMFTVYLVNTNLGNNATLMIRLLSTTKWPHITFTGTCGGNALLEFIEGPTINAAGGALAERNNKRSAGAKAPTVTAFSNPTIAGGTVLVNALLPGGTGGNSSGGLLRADTEFIGARNEDYVVRLTNIAGNNQPASIVVNWYEETNN